ncbi:MAG: Tfp pilus assembly protein FimT/FimU [Planctomycetota bacterium]
MKFARLHPGSARPIPAGSSPTPSRRAYTLVEMLIVVGIVMLLLSMTLLTVRFVRDGDRVTSAASRLQSFLGGARDRAVYARKPRGVRLFLDAKNPRTVTSMAYIDPADTWTDGLIQLRRWDPDLNGATNTNGNIDINQDGGNDDPREVWMVVGEGTGWGELKRRGLLIDGMRIRIPKGPEGSWYPINTRLIDISQPPPTTQVLVLGLPYRDPGDTPKDRSVAYESGGPEDYEIELQPRLLPIEPVALNEGVCIDLDGSKIPEAWRPWASGVAQSSGNAQYSQYIDIVYSPRGNLVGESASGGLIHFCVCDSADAKNLKDQYLLSLDPDPATALQKFNRELRLSGGTFVPADVVNSATAAWIAPLDPNGEGYPLRDRRIVSVFTQTGAVSVHPVNALDTENNGAGNGFADDPYYYAEVGEVAK